MCNEGTLYSWALLGKVTKGLTHLGRRQVQLIVVAECHVVPMIATSKDCNPCWVPYSFIVQTLQKCQGSPSFIGFLQQFNIVILDQSTSFLSWVSCPILDIFLDAIALFVIYDVIK
jgi:hypothetical protein